MSLLTAVADPIRWRVLQRLAGAPSCVCELQEQAPVAANLLSYHLRVLREAGLVTTSRRGAGSTTRWPTTRWIGSEPPCPGRSWRGAAA